MKVWVVGASGGIGSSCVRALKMKNEVYTPQADVRWPVRSLQAVIEAREPEVLVYAAGINYLDWSDNIQPDEMLAVYDVNVVGLLRCIQAASSLEKVVVIGSDASRRPMRTSIAYNASKAALEAAVRVIARERAHQGFIINIVAPGLIRGTEMTRKVVERTRLLRPDLDIEEYMLEQIPQQRMGTVGEVASVVRWLIEDAPEYLNGAVIDVNGAR